MNLISALADLLEGQAKCGTTHLISIDGHAGAGKTTLAGELFLAFSLTRQVEVIHLEEIYGGWKDAVGPSLTQALTKLLEDLSNERTSLLPVFNWEFMEFDSPKEISPHDLIIIEGVGSAQEIVRKYATATIWLDVDPTTGLQRVLARDGMGIREQMLDWQVKEDAHFLKDHTRETADFILSAL
jgi:uridine kinase